MPRDGEQATFNPHRSETSLRCRTAPDHARSMPARLPIQCSVIRLDIGDHGSSVVPKLWEIPTTSIDGRWTRVKGFDGFCPLGPWVDRDVNPTDLHIGTLLNGQVVHDSRTSDMVFDPLRLVSFVSGVVTLLPGDVVLTVPPGGIGPIDLGDTVEVRIEGIGTLKNRLV